MWNDAQLRAEEASAPAGLSAVAPRADLVLLEGLVNVDENAEFVETLRWGRTYLDIVRWFATIAP
jgi:hypothetical protein